MGPGRSTWADQEATGGLELKVGDRRQGKTESVGAGEVISSHTLDTQGESRSKLRLAAAPLQHRKRVLPDLLN